MSFTHSLYQLRDYGAAPLWKLFTLRFPLECPYSPLFAISVILGSYYVSLN